MKAAVMALAGLVAFAPPAAAEQTQTEHFDRTIPFAAGGRVKLKNFSGTVRITGASSNDVVIRAVRRATRERLDHIKLDVQVQGSTIEIEANRRESFWRERNNNVVETDFDIQVPLRTDLDVHVFSSPITITGVEGRQKLYSFSGKIMLREATGPIEAETFSGDVDLDVTRSPRIPELDIETFSGDVTARVAEGGAAHVEFSGFGGDFHSDIPLTYRSGSARKVNADIGGGGGPRLRFHTFGGSVRLVK
jgi:DUF4097 and DUF4098 domain-containing protein YvlB